ncbi:hypothetical protein AKJ45_02710 [candidate division MSBL1 archaeon SCGC-AAA261F19]|uniref:Translation initiation factor 6 n=2 Tax=candidate division MSBL1 TaxID=215777 RepID=A0A133V9G1_9EURY|nr:hypothetical protein AKJ43_01365 [candidate division MSBL1 archaeon SCGC-AAA261D19]KXB03045.1 hypothetical protein AKJ45_02710 [candidate division MSBL1 archaeon SCGC-AAA261F19]
MGVVKINFDHIPYLGLFTLATDNLLIVPKRFRKIPEKTIKEAMDVQVIQSEIYMSPLIGVLSAGNRSGAVVPDLFGIDEKRLQKELGIKTVQVPGKYTALGNHILANDNGALVNPDLPDEVIEIISETLNVSTKQSTIAGLKSVGSAGVATNRGALLHSDASKEELKIAEETLGVPADVGTASRGIKYVGVCIAANSKGALTGKNTTGPELGRIESSLGFL